MRNQCSVSLDTIHKDKNKVTEVIYTYRDNISINQVRKKGTIEDLLFLRYERNAECTNFIITRNGEIRSKPNTQAFRVVYNADTVDLRRYKNSKHYDGNTDKFGVTIKGNDYIVKSPKDDGDFSCFSEYVASHFINNMGYSAHQTELVRDKNMGIVVLLLDFTSAGRKLRSYKATGQSSEDTDIETKYYTYEDVTDMILKHTKIPTSLKTEALRNFWVMYLFDAILGNRDRHHGNWGYLTGKQGYQIAPIYDNGACLFPNVNKWITGYNKENRYKFISDRSEKYPASVLQEFSSAEGRNKKTNYFEYIGRQKAGVFLEVYNEFFNFPLEKIVDSARQAVSNDLIPDNLKKFYIDVIVMRYLHIIKRMSLDDSYKELLKYD